MGDPGIEPGMGLPGGVTVRCRTLQHVAQRPAPRINSHLVRQATEIETVKLVGVTPWKNRLGRTHPLYDVPFHESRALGKS